MAKKVEVTKEVAEKFVEFVGSMEYEQIVIALPGFNKQEKARYALLDMLALINATIAPVVVPGTDGEIEPTYDDDGEVVPENSEAESEIPTQAQPTNEFEIDFEEINELVEIVDELIVEKSRKDKLEERNVVLRDRIAGLSQRTIELIGGKDQMQNEFAGAINLAKQAIGVAKKNHADESESAFARLIELPECAGLKHLVSVYPDSDENQKKFIEKVVGVAKKKILNGGTSIIRNILAEIADWTLKLEQFEAEYVQVTAEIRKLTSEIGSNNAEITEFLKKYPMYAPKQAAKQFIPTQKDDRKNKNTQKHQQPRRVLYGLDGLDSARQVILGNK